MQLKQDLNVVFKIQEEMFLESPLCKYGDVKTRGESESGKTSLPGQL